MRRTSVFWAVALIALGVLLLLRETVDAWRDVSLGGLVLIAIGTWLLFERPRYGRLIIGPMSKPGTILEGTFSGGVESQVRRLGDGVEVTLRQRWHPAWRSGWGHRTGRGFDWALTIDRDVPAALDVRSGASTGRLELEELLVTELTLETGASHTDLVLPRRGQSTARLQAGAAQVWIRIPTGVAAAIRVRRGLAAIRVDTSRFPQTADGYRSPDFDSAPNRVDLEIEAGAAEVTVG